MAAPLGFKTFNTGDVLTAADTNGYLMQGVWTFANAAARTAAVTSPQEGNISYLKDTDALEIYTGAAWVGYGSGDITGVTTGASSGLTGGVTSGTADLKFNTTAKGGLLIGTGSGTVSELAVGTNNYVLTADSTQTTGVKWAAAAAGGTSNYSLLNSGGTALTGASTITVSSISGQEKIVVVVDGASSANASAEMYLRINADSGTNYWYGGQRLVGDSTAYLLSNSNGFRTTTTSIYLGQMSDNSGSTISAGISINGGTTTGGKSFQGACGTARSTGLNYYTSVVNGVYLGSAAITSVSIISSTGNFDAGTIYVYGSA